MSDCTIRKRRAAKLQGWDSGGTMHVMALAPFGRWQPECPDCDARLRGCLTRKMAKDLLHQHRVKEHRWTR